MNPEVFNLSFRAITNFDIKLLPKRLIYAFTPLINYQELKTDIKAYSRRFRLKEQFLIDLRLFSFSVRSDLSRT